MKKNDHTERLNQHVRDMMQWHFDEHTGSAFWLDKAKTLPFNPRQDIQGFEDLRLFPNVTKELMYTDINDLIPSGYANDTPLDVGIFESGGATGKPKRIIEIETRKAGVEWVNSILDLHQFPGKETKGNWLFIGPSGPHIVGKSVNYLARLRGSLCHYIDFDPRWVRKCIKNGDKDIAGKYMSHILHQVKDILSDQHISVLFVTPSVLEKMIQDNLLGGMIRDKVRGLLWSGTSFSAESLRWLKDELLPDTVIVGLYGNTLMGIAVQRPLQADDQYTAVFHNYFPYSIVDVVDFSDDSRKVDYFQIGRIKVTLLTKEMFIPNNLERDQAIRIPPMDESFFWDGVAEVRPFSESKSRIIEGVY